MNESSRTIIMGILVLAGRRLSATQLVRLAAPLGLSATNVKSHLTRMVAEGVLEREGPTRLASYCPSADQLAVVEGIQARLNTTREEPWDQGWMMLALNFPQRRGHRERLRASLWFDGWRPVGTGVFVRPAWPCPWAEDSARQYATHALGFCVRGVWVARPVELGALYDLRGLDSEARRLAAWIAQRRISAKSPQAAFVERMNVGARVAQLIGHDPRLPPIIWGKRRGMQEMVDAFRRFEDRIAPQAQKFMDEDIDGPSTAPIGPRRKT
jgi:DNA-binding transcriptional regulator PaaX